jgi:hypothetical protein
MIGKPIHLASNHHGTQFVLVAVDGDEITVSTGNGRNRRLLTAPARDAQLPRKHMKGLTR